MIPVSCALIVPLLSHFYMHTRAAEHFSEVALPASAIKNLQRRKIPVTSSLIGKQHDNAHIHTEVRVCWCVEEGEVAGFGQVRPSDVTSQ